MFPISELSVPLKIAAIAPARPSGAWPASDGLRRDSLCNFQDDKGTGIRLILCLPNQVRSEHTGVSSDAEGTARNPVGSTQCRIRGMGLQLRGLRSSLPG
ncbi:MAG: hypothetical protein DRP70_10740 [Spirochaetes bacterium]|nr:MAG: hypothetical protein DRP60_12725 [Spirochaetota bacterium]RKX86077.1 MAG: hypothetical protein DRP70_10740 [Spirochaetota bacterium]